MEPVRRVARMYLIGFGIALLMVGLGGVLNLAVRLVVFMVKTWQEAWWFWLGAIAFALAGAAVLVLGGPRAMMEESDK